MRSGGHGLAEVGEEGQSVPMVRPHRYYLNEMMPSRWSYADPDEAGGTVLGGEAALWSEFINGANLERSVWPVRPPRLPMASPASRPPFAAARGSGGGAVDAEDLALH